MTEPAEEPLFDPEVPAPAEAVPQADSPGAQLLDERRNQGLSLGDIARQLKLSVRQIEALERDDYASFSGPVFVRGFLRNYAKLLHLDPERLLAAASLSVAPAAVHATAEAYVPVSAASPERRRKFIAWGAFVVLAVLVVFLLAANVSKNRPNTQGPETAQPTPAGTPSTPAATPQHADSPPAASKSPTLAAAAEPTAKTSPAPVTAAEPPEPKSIAASPAPSTTPAATTSIATALGAAQPTVPDPVAANAAGTPRPQSPSSGSGVSQIHMIFEGESWVEVKDGSGATIYSRLNTPGTERVVRGTPPLTVVVGNAHGVKLMYQDRVVDLEPHTRVDVARITLE